MNDDGNSVGGVTDENVTEADGTDEDVTGTGRKRMKMNRGNLIRPRRPVSRKLSGCFTLCR